MKKKFILLTLLIAVAVAVFIGVSLTASADEDKKIELNENIIKLLEDLDLSELQKYLDENEDSYLFQYGDTAGEIIKYLIQGNLNTDYGGYLNELLSILFKNVISLIPAFATVVAVAERNSKFGGGKHIGQIDVQNRSSCLLFIDNTYYYVNAFGCNLRLSVKHQQRKKANRNHYTDTHNADCINGRNEFGCHLPAVRDFFIKRSGGNSGRIYFSCNNRSYCVEFYVEAQYSDELFRCYCAYEKHNEMGNRHNRNGFQYFYNVSEFRIIAVRRNYIQSD